MLFGAAKKEAKSSHFEAVEFCLSTSLLLEGRSGAVSLVKLDISAPDGLASLRQPFVL